MALGWETMIALGPKRTTVPYWRCKSVCIWWASPVVTHDRRTRLVRAAKRGPGICLKRMYEWNVLKTAMNMAITARIQAKREILPSRCPESCTRSMAMTGWVDFCKSVRALDSRLWTEIVAPVFKVDRACESLREYNLAIHGLEFESLGSEDSAVIVEQLGFD